MTRFDSAQRALLFIICKQYDLKAHLGNATKFSGQCLNFLKPYKSYKTNKNNFKNRYHQKITTKIISDQFSYPQIFQTRHFN